ncbi:MAG: ATP-dependent zinc metalloprotease FtsH [Planctomycetes bacterium]|nr:ATP-dependent zinc metalloprotease FtsH [Planctomycetota bacterium]
MEIAGPNTIEAELTENRGAISVEYPSLTTGDNGGLVGKFTEIQRQGPYVRVQDKDFQRALAEGAYTPRDARIVSLRQNDGGTARAGSKSAETGDRIDRLFVQVFASARAGWQEKHPGEEPRFPIGEKSGLLWLEVQGFEDLHATSAVLASANVAVDTVELNLGRSVEYKNPNSIWSTIFIYLLPWVLIFVVFLIFMRQMRNQGAAGGVMSFGRSRAQLYSKENHTNVTFDDVAGADEAKDEVREIVEFLKNPGRFTRVGGRIPRGVLLVGPPGCGKTLLAKAIAGEADVPFFSISGSDFVEMFVGVGASRVRDLFKQARENSPCIIFLDEIDAVGRRRGSGLGGGHDEREQTLNAILVEMDGFGTDEGIIVVAATNRPDVLDPALLRPGRFDREVVIDLPDVKGREDILRVHLKKVKTDGDVHVSTLARSTPGYSGADLAAIINEAAIMAALAKKDEVCMEHLEEARDKVRYGRQKKSRKIEEEDRKITAYHEAGHAVVASVLPEVDDPHKVTIVPRGRALGSTMVLPDKESYHMQKKKMLGQLSVLFGGRVSEAHFCGDISAGASDDIRRATELARAMVTELGMSDKIGPINYAERQGSDFLGTELMSGKWHSEDTARQIDQEVEGVLKHAYTLTETIVRENAVGIEAVTQGLLRFETITGDEVRKLIAGASLDTLRPTPPAPPPQKPTATAPVTKPGTYPRGGELPGKPGLSPA